MHPDPQDRQRLPRTSRVHVVSPRHESRPDCSTPKALGEGILGVDSGRCNRPRGRVRLNVLAEADPEVVQWIGMQSACGRFGRKPTSRRCFPCRTTIRGTRPSPSTPETDSSVRPGREDAPDAARASAGGVGTDPRHAGAGKGLAFSPPVLPGRSVAAGWTESTEDRQRGLEDFRRALGAKPPGAPEQIQCFAVPGHKADFGIVMAGPDLRAIHDVQMAVQAFGPGAGARSRPIRSIRSPRSRNTSLTPTITPGSCANARASIPIAACSRPRLASYAERLGPMNRQRLYPEFPNWPCLCFYPMSKMRTRRPELVLAPV